MTDESKSTVNIGDVEGGIRDAQIAGRDIINNIVVVGQFLNFAQIEGLLPEGCPAPDLSALAGNLEGTLRDQLGDRMTDAVAGVGEMLGDVLSAWKPARPGAAFPFKRMLPALASTLLQKLRELDYWDTFTEVGFSARFQTRYRVLWLESLNQLWQKNGFGDDEFGLVEMMGEGTFVLRAPNGDISLAYYPNEPHLGKFAAMRNDQFRVFLAGLVIDLLRLASTAADDVQFWQNVTDLLTPASDT